MASRAAELEWLHMIVAEESHLLIPVSHSLVPVVIWSCQGLLVNIKVLSHSKPGCLPAV